MNEIIEHLEKLHTTELGEIRIKNNLDLDDIDVVKWCKEKISCQSAVITRKGKNLYVSTDGAIITVNAYSYTIITAHRK